MNEQLSDDSIIKTLSKVPYKKNGKHYYEITNNKLLLRQMLFNENLQKRKTNYLEH